MARPPRPRPDRGLAETGLEIDRVVLFSDAVFAIAMTLLALSLHIPSATRDRHVADAIQDAMPEVFTYVFSFGVISLYWLAHHRMYRYVARLDAPMLALNLATLCAVAFVPFPTQVLGDHGGTRAAVVFYAATMTVLGAIVTASWWYASFRGGLMRSETPPELVRHSLWRSITFPAVFALSIPIAFVDPSAAEWSWLLIFLLRLVLRRRYGSIYRTA